MVDDNGHAEAISREKRLEQDRADLNNEMADNETGRAPRFGVLETKQQEAKSEEKRKRTAFEQLMQSMAYHEAWTNAMEALNRSNELVYQVLRESADHLSNAQRSHRALLGQAATLPSGEKVFRAETGDAYKETGEQLSMDELADIDWQAGNPSWEAYAESKLFVRTVHNDYDVTLSHQARLDEINDELHNKDEPLSLERLGELENEANEIAKSLDLSSKKDVEFERSNNSAPIFVPDLTF